MRHLQRVALIAATALAAAPAAAETLYVQTGRLIDGVSNEARTGQCVTIEDEHIKAVGPCGKARGASSPGSAPCSAGKGQSLCRVIGAGWQDDRVTKPTES